MPQSQDYQVQEQDRDLLTLAARLNTNYQTLKQLNPSIQSISQGQIINRPVQGPLPLPSPTPNLLTGSFLSGSGAVNTGTGASVPSFTGSPPPGYGPGAGFSQPPQATPPPSATGSFLSGSGAVNTGALERVYALRNTLSNPNLQQSQLPQMILAGDASAAGYNPSQMLQAGYVLQNGQWRLGTSVAAQQGAAGGGVTGDIPDSQRMIMFNRNAKNRHSRFVTNLKWAKNAWKRKKMAAKGYDRNRTEPGVVVRQDSPSTTLDLVLGS